MLFLQDAENARVQKRYVRCARRCCSVRLSRCSPKCVSPLHDPLTAITGASSFSNLFERMHNGIMRRNPALNDFVQQRPSGAKFLRRSSTAPRRKTVTLPAPLQPNQSDGASPMVRARSNSSTDRVAARLRARRIKRQASSANGDESSLSPGNAFEDDSPLEEVVPIVENSQRDALEESDSRGRGGDGDDDYDDYDDDERGVGAADNNNEEKVVTAGDSTRAVGTVDDIDGDIGTGSDDEEADNHGNAVTASDNGGAVGTADNDNDNDDDNERNVGTAGGVRVATVEGTSGDNGVDEDDAHDEPSHASTGPTESSEAAVSNQPKTVKRPKPARRSSMPAQLGDTKPKPANKRYSAKFNTEKLDVDLFDLFPE